ncbi:MFS transporter [Coxiella endosymbiont of Amblyomma sculptum]|uniref:MFS transporter n=1 Tax=Coxiella endosymbiont of Amblyomma sculptum TaxID=2487929 RepID=UPI00132F1849|nr:MFS transporter [Coxiella endosymbiont of Amblyomma sculptum]QHG92463.1 MFS transporter [Coxiella endosymbiont of Amblyomma sculptum]
MYAKERTAVISLAVIMAFRMLGSFMLFPVLSLYTNRIPYATPTLVGLALGIYGLLQACFQIPFGSISDRIGRKPVIAMGLVFLGVGSVLSVLSRSIYGIIVGRFLQGAGAIGSTVLAMVSDSTRDEDRSKAMALVGVVVGCAFVVAFTVGPIINAWFCLKGIFYTTAIFATLGIILLYTVVPSSFVSFRTSSSSVSGSPEKAKGAGKTSLKKLICNSELLRLDFGVFSLHCILTAMFIGIPIVLSQIVNLTEHEQVFLYLVILLFAFSVSMPVIVLSERRHQIKSIVVGSIVLMTICQFLLMVFYRSTIEISIILFLFFAAFTLLEAVLPSLVSKTAPVCQKGTALGMYSSAQFLGIFLGGSAGGWIFNRHQWIGVLVFCAIVSLLWLILVLLPCKKAFAFLQ